MAEVATALPPRLSVGLLLKTFPWRVATTWLLTLLENTLLALLPLFIGRAIDVLLTGQAGGLGEVAALMVALLLIASGRRVYDTRCYGSIRVWLGSALAQRLRAHPVTRVTARLDMSRELVDFLEVEVPELLTAAVQLAVSIVVLWAFDFRLGLAGLMTLGLLALGYLPFHRPFYLLNATFNSQLEQQVSVLTQRRPGALRWHLWKLRASEVKISDREALLYSVLFAILFVFVLINLRIAATLEGVTAGMLFAILSYSLQLVESSIALPAALQQWSRLSEISERISEAEHSDPEHAEPGIGRKDQ
ncbi:MAG: ABC transporter six-transmembrane domain-containing protein [Pseudomonadota bacterium]